MPIRILAYFLDSMEASGVSLILVFVEGMGWDWGWYKWCGIRRCKFILGVGSGGGVNGESVEVILYCSGLERGRSGISVGQMGKRGCCVWLVTRYGILHLVLYC